MLIDQFHDFELKSGVNEIVVKRKMRRGMSVMYKKASVMAKISKDLTSFMAVNGNSNPKRKQSIVSSHTESSNTSSINISPMMLEKNTSVSPF